MTPPRALIAEDEPLLAEGLRADLAALWPQLDVIAAVGDGDRALAAVLAERPEVVFLDIRMPGRSGLEVAQALAEDWPAGVAFPLLVFVTAYEAHALAAFDAQAADYLVKPVDRPRLAACVARLQRRLADRAAPAAGLEQALGQLRGLLGATQATAPRLQVIQAQSGALVHLVPVDDVIYFEAADKYVRVLTAGAEHLIRTPLKELLPQLDPERFWQVHRGTVVQARCIASARRDDSGKVFLSLRGRPETLVASRLYAHRFKGM
jgi:DNA-binding LytR/AlgR family response regulator